MPDHKTVTFDASQWQLVPKVPTDAMLDAAACASMQHLIDYINDPEKAKEICSEENVRKTHASRYHSMLAAAPTPAAQSAGQEAVALTDAEILDIGCRVFGAHECTPTFGAVLQFGQELRALLTAPVNGGERELGQLIDERDQYHDAAEKLADAIAKHFGVEIGEHSNLNCPRQNALDHISQATTRAAGSPQVSGDGWLAEAERLIMRLCDTTFTWARGPKYYDQELTNRTAANAACDALKAHLRSALSSPAKMGGSEDSDSAAGARLRTVMTLAGAGDAVSGMSDADADACRFSLLAFLRRELEKRAKVGGDEREAFKAALSKYAKACFISENYHELNATRDQVLSIYDRAALSADGGERKPAGC
ncbi:hypothetical protein [Pandoraea sp. B-6]|uniref:hypothetical protein n=1 Tax=Pandoraea sp. B-6 TaxID=1204340 RepID=UPI0003480928|nr:hypothetical protein [Pandoraea sp. B-6]